MKPDSSALGVEEIPPRPGDTGLELALRESEQRFATFADSLPALAWMADANGWIRWYNRRWFEYTGTTPEQMEGWGWRSVHDPKVLPAVMERWERSIASGLPFEMVFPLKGADGVFRSFQTRVAPVKDEAGMVTGWVGTNAEVDDLQRTFADQEALRQSEERLRLALAAAPTMGTFDWNIPERKLQFDERLCRIFGIDPALGAAGFPADVFHLALHPEDRERVARLVAETLATGKEYATEYRAVQPDGTLRWVSAHGSCLFDDEGRPVRSLGVCLDVTERKLTEKALIQNEKLAAVGRLAASIAHEMNNPLEAVTNLLYLARRSDDAQEIAEYVETAEQELLRVSAICNQTLRFNRQPTKPTRVTCDELLASVLSIYKGRMKNYRVTLEERKRAQEPVLCFEGEIRQVLSNLVGNALDAMALKPGQLLLRSRDATEWQTGARGIVVTVADTGSGMSAQAARKAFEPFFTTKDIAGTGLGLWISHEIVARHRGSLRFKTSQREGGSGTVFRVFLPAEAAVRD